jgi:hypothetical protein
MATLHKDIFIQARPEQIWDAVRDVGALHTRLVPGFVRDTRVEGETRVVTFANGAKAREAASCGRLTYSLTSEPNR